MADQIDPKHLKGLKFHSATVKTVTKEGRKVKQYTPTERALRPGDVLSWKEHEDEMVICTADGEKHRVAKSA